MKFRKPLFGLVLGVCMAATLFSVPALATGAAETADEDTVILNGDVIEGQPGSGVLPSMASGTWGDNLSWKLNYVGVLTISGEGAMKPAEVDELYPWAEHAKSIRSVVIEDGVTSVSDQAFAATYSDDYGYISYLSLKKLELGNTVNYIGYRAFANSGITELVLPDSLTTLDSAAFSGCNQLSTLVTGDGLYQIGLEAFNGCRKLSSITFGTGLGYIHQRAFSSCTALTELNIPARVEHILDSAFSGCTGLTSVTIGDGHTDRQLTHVGDWAFQNCSALTEVHFGDSVGQIGMYTFQNCSKLSTVTFGDNLIAIGDHTFKACPITTLSFPASLTVIGYDAFTDCKELTSISFAGPTGIGVRAFQNCSKLSEVDFGSNLTYIDNAAFQNCTSLTEINIPDSAIGIGSNSFTGCTSLRSVTISGNDAKGTTVGIQAFYGLPSLTSLTLGNGVARLESGAFWKCTGLKKVTIPSSVWEINGAFMDCTGLTTVVMKEGDPSRPFNLIGGAFAGCTSLTTVRLDQTISQLADRIFQNCTALRQVFLNVADSAGVTTIEGNPFDTMTQGDIFFFGHAPYFKDGIYQIANSTPISLYYLQGSEGWENYESDGVVKPFLDGSTGPITDPDAYYPLPGRQLYRFYANSTFGSPLTNVTATLNGKTYSSGDSSSLTIEYDAYTHRKDDVIVFSCPGYDSKEQLLLSGNSYITLHTSETEGDPRHKSLLVRGGPIGKTIWNMMWGDYSFYAGDTKTMYRFEIDVIWGEHQPGKIYFSQTLDPADGLEMQEGTSDYMAFAADLDPALPLYLLLVTQDGTVFPTEIPVDIYPLPSGTTSKPQNVSSIYLDIAEDVEAPETGINYLDELEIGMKLLNSANITFDVQDDGSFYGLIGLEVEKKDSIHVIAETMEDLDAFSNIHDYADSMDNLKDFLTSGEASSLFYLDPPKTTAFIVEGEAQVIGYVKGVWTDEGPRFTECRVGLLVEGKFEKVWQFVEPVPFYFQAGFYPSLELTAPLVSTVNGQMLYLQKQLEFKGEANVKGAAGLGLDGIASVSLYAKGGLVAEGTLPTKDIRIYADKLTLGVEAELLCWDADVELLSLPEYTIYPKEETVNLSSMALPELNWQPQSRAYLDTVSVLAVDGSNTETSAEALLSDVYTYADVQLVVLEDGTQLMVWTADPGTRAEANNRTVLYYSCHSGSGWSAPAPVEAEDDGTADFSPLLTQLEGKVYLLWQDASQPLTEDDTLDSAAGLLDISCAEFDPETAAFSPLGTIGTSGYDGAFSAAVYEGELVVAWMANSGTSPLHFYPGDASLHRAVLSGSHWTSRMLADNLNTADQTATDGKRVWFSGDTDNDNASFEDMELFLWDDETDQLLQLTDNDVIDSKPQFHDGQLFRYSDGALVSDTAAIALAENTDVYRYLRSSADLEAMVYVVTEPDTRLSSLYASFNDGTGWGDPIRLDGGNGNIGSFSAAFRPDGSLVIVTRERAALAPVSGDALPELSVGAQLISYTLTPTCDLVLEKVDYEAHSLVAGGELNLRMNLSNAGATAIQFVLVTVSDGGTELYRVPCMLPMLSGCSEQLTVAVPLPATLPEELQVTVSALGYEEAKTENNTAALPLRLADVSIESVLGVSANNVTTVDALVVNRGQQDFDAVTLTLKDAAGNVLTTQPNVALDAGESCIVTLSLNQPFDHNTILRLEAGGLENENLAANNEADVVVLASRPEVLTLSADYFFTDTALNVSVRMNDATAEDCDYNLYCAAYDSNGRMLAVRTADGQHVVSGGFQTREFSFTKHLTQIAEIRVFALDSELKSLPVGDRLTIERP